MNANFKIGEVAIFQNAEIYPHFNGTECVVIEAGIAVIGRGGEQISYRVGFPCGFRGCAGPHQLRRRKPPTTGEESVLAMFKPATKREGAPA